jgi:hypothetical protein
MDNQRQRSKLAQELVPSRRQLQEEASRLIASIQEECNSVFRSKLVVTSPKESCPRTVVDLDDEDHNAKLSDIGTSTSTVVTATNQSFTVPLQQTVPEWDPLLFKSEAADVGPLQASPIIHQVDKTLDEREVLVRSPGIL